MSFAEWQMPSPRLLLVPLGTAWMVTLRLLQRAAAR